MELHSNAIDRFIEHALQYGRRKVAAVSEKEAKPAKPASINRGFSAAPRIRKLSKVGNARQGFFLKRNSQALVA